MQSSAARKHFKYIVPLKNERNNILQMTTARINKNSQTNCPSFCTILCSNFYSTFKFIRLQNKLAFGGLTTS